LLDPSNRLEAMGNLKDFSEETPLMVQTLHWFHRNLIESPPSIDDKYKELAYLLQRACWMGHIYPSYMKLPFFVCVFCSTMPDKKILT
jgi:hypothetical protein